MIKIINIVFYILGIGFPLLIILVAMFKKSNHKIKNIVNKTLIAVIIFLIFYIVKVGGINIVKKTTANKDIKIDNTTSTRDNNKETSTTFTTKEIETTLKQTTTKNITTKETTTSVAKEKIEGAKYIDGILIANKSYPLPENFVPTNTYKDATGLKYCTSCIDNDAYNNYELMKSDASALGLNIWIQSGYRSYELQKDLYDKYVNRDGKEAADTYSARPGHSEHQTGLAFDLNSISDEFQYTNEGIWVNNNAYKYGFILRYPKGKENITGYKYESWHLRYVGVDLATKLYNNGDWITLEEHFNIKSEYSD